MLMADPQRRKAGRFKRYAQRAVVGLGAVLGFVFLAVVGLLFSLRFATVRNLVVTKVNGALADSFRGKIKLHDLGSVGLGGIGAADAEIFDPAGRRVIDIHGVDVNLSVPTIAWAAIAHSSKPLTVRFDSISLKHVEVLLVDDGKGSPTLADAFQPKTPSAPSSGPGTIIIIDKAIIDHVWAHGQLASTPPLDVELKDALASLRVDDAATTVVFDKAGIRARGLPQSVDPVGQLRASLVLPAAPTKPIDAKAHYEGTAANVPLVLDASFVDNNIAATVDASNIPPEAVNKQVSGLQLRSPASLHANAAGKMPDVHGNFALGIGAGKVDGDFVASLNNDMNVTATVRTHDLDLAELAPTAPASGLDLTLHAGALIPQQGPITGNFALDTGPSVVAAETVPGIALSGTFSADSKAKRNHVEAHAEIAEPGAQTSIDATVEQGVRTNVEFKTRTKVQNPPRLKRLAALSSAQGELTTQGSYQVDTSSLNADVNGDLRNVQQGANRIARTKLTAKVTGALPHPNANVFLDVTDADFSGQHVTSAQVAVRGSLSHAAVTAEVATRGPERHVQLSTLVSNDHGITVDHPSVNLTQGDNHIKISANTVQIVDGRTRVNGLHVDGAGKADVSLVYGPGLESANIQTYDLDLARLYHMVDPQAQLRSGTATVTVSYDRRGGNPRARILAASKDLSFGRVKGGAFAADLDLDDGQLNGSANADLKQFGHMSFDFQNLRGINVDNLQPEQITGKVAVAGQMQLRDLNRLVPPDSNLPIARMLGSVTYDAAIERTHAGPGLPTLHAHVSTKKLQLAGARTSKTTINTKAEALAAAPVAIKGIDIDVDVKHEESGETELAASVADEHGRLAALSIEGKATPHMATIATELASQWKQIPLSVKLTVPPRELQELPVEVRPTALAGLASAEFTYDGTFSAPELKLVGKVDNFRQDALSKKRMNLAFDASYDGLHGKFAGTARSGNRDVAKADLDFETAVNAWLDKTGDATPPLDANANLSFDALPIALLPGTATSQVDGALSGKLALAHFGKDASVDGNFDAAKLTVGGAPFGNIHTEMKVLNGKADALLRVDGEHGATTTAEAHSGMDWGARYVPEVKLPADAQLRAKDLRIGAFSPLVASVFGELDGRLNGDLNAHFRGGAPELDGHVDLEDGVAQVASIGQRFDKVTAKLSLESGKAKLEQLSARPTAGRIAVAGEARFDGLNLTGAEGHVRMARSEAVAMTLAGTEITGTYGAIDIGMTPNPATHATVLKVTIPDLHVGMPDTGSQDLQDLDPAKGVRVGVNQRTGGFVTLALQPLKDTDPSKNDNPMAVDVHLGSIELQRGDMLKAQVNGDLHMLMGSPMTMTGEINLQGGKLDVSGKRFEIDSGTVSFSGDPASPTIVATAVWDAGDDEKHRVYADFSGTATKGKIAFRSEPPLTQDQILSLLLTGSADGSLGGGSGGGSNAATAVGAVGGSATQGLNKVLSGISNVDVSTRIDTSTGSARPEIVIQISRRVAAQITRALGTPPPTDPPDLTFLTFDFRIKSHWSLDALVGDHGESGLDLVWRKRY